MIKDIVQSLTERQEQEQREIAADPHKDVVFAVVLTREEIPLFRFADEPMRVQYVNKLRPFVIVESEMKTREMLNTQYPNSLVVIAPKFYFLQGGFDLVFDDFKEPLTPTGVPPKQFKYAGQIDSLILQMKKDKVDAKLIERAVMDQYPESETAKFVNKLYASIETRRLMQMGSTIFDHHLPMRDDPTSSPMNALLEVHYDPSSTSVEAIASFFSSLLDM